MSASVRWDFSAVHGAGLKSSLFEPPRMLPVTNTTPGIFPHHILDKLGIVGISRIERRRLSPHLLVVSAQRVAGPGEEQVAYARWAQTAAREHAATHKTLARN